MDKNGKAIKRLSKQLKKLNARIETMSEQVNILRDASGNTVIEPVAKELQVDSGIDFTAQTAPRFSEDQMEMAYGATNEAEEVLDILEKEVERGAKQASARRKSRKRVKHELKKRKRNQKKEVKKKG